MAGLYIHIPFCKQACHYCDFHFSTDSSQWREMVHALGKEIELQEEFPVSPLKTIYFGGGTPSLLPVESINSLLEKIRSNFSVAADTEITLEANPDDLTLQKAESLIKIGVNRLSIGIQSFDDAILKYLNRAHDGANAIRCLADARQAGFGNISLDLIYAIPGLLPERWKEALLQALGFKPEHISTYSLTIEDKTVFGNKKKKGTLRPISEEDEASQFETLVEILESSGYEHYEVSNFCRPGYSSRHNSSYWSQKPYLGIGPSAHSYNGTSRYVNIKNNSRYVQSIAQGIVPCEEEILTPENKINEYILTTLRTQRGCDLHYLLQELHDDLVTRCGLTIPEFLESGLISIDNHILIVTKKGKLLTDKITEQFMV